MSIYGLMRRVRVGSPTAEIVTAHWLYSHVHQGVHLAVFVIRSIGNFTIDYGGFEEMHPELYRLGGPDRKHPINLRYDGYAQGALQIFGAHDHPDDIDRIHSWDRELRLSASQQHESGLPVWTERDWYGDTGRSFLYFAGYDSLIPVVGWIDWLQKWKNPVDPMHKHLR